MRAYMLLTPMRGEEPQRDSRTLKGAISSNRQGPHPGKSQSFALRQPAIPGPVTTSIVGGGLFSDPFSFIEQSPPWLPPDLPLPPWPTPSSGGTRTCSEKKKSEPQLFNICLDYPCGKGKQKFIESWSCTGDWACCLPLKDKFVDSCYDRGKGYVAHEYWYNKSAPEVDCCYCAE